MRASWLDKRRTLFLIVFLVIFSAFTADILDLREELRFFPTPYGALDNNIGEGMTAAADAAPQPTPVFGGCAAHGESSVEISFLHLLPYGFRAPPSRS